MRILLDTNILIYREDDHVLAPNLQRLMRALGEMKAEMLIHPLSINEINKDKDETRRRIMNSKIQAYRLLESPPNPMRDTSFSTLLGHGVNSPIPIDEQLLYAVYKNAIDLLITEDKGIHRRAKRLGIEDSVLDIDESVTVFEQDSMKGRPVSPPALKEVPVHTLDFNDQFFDSLKKGYPDFEEWFIKISKEGRKGLVHLKRDGSVGALLITKVEDESVDSDPPLPKMKRVKICTFKVTNYGQRIGELFVKLAVEISVKYNISEIYLTHFVEENDRLIELLQDYGFHEVAKKKDEVVFLKRTKAASPGLGGLDPYEFDKEYYPSFYDGIYVQKFIVPIRPEFHDKLFTDTPKRQTKLPEHGGGFIVEGNAIKKAYICNSKIKRIKRGDLIFFYRSGDRRELTSVGVVEQVRTGVRDANSLLQMVHKRTVYSKEEIEEILDKPAMVIMFRHHIHLARPLPYSELKQAGVLAAAPQSFIKISESRYFSIKILGGIDESYTVH